MGVGVSVGVCGCVTNLYYAWTSGSQFNVHRTFVSFEMPT